MLDDMSRDADIRKPDNVGGDADTSVPNDVGGDVDTGVPDDVGGDTETCVPNDIGGCGSGDITGTSPSPSCSSYSSSYVIMHNCNGIPKQF